MADIYRLADSFGEHIASGANKGLPAACEAHHPDSFKGPEGTTALMRAAYMGHTEKVQVLLAAGADPSIQDAEGRTALHWAAEGISNADTVGALLGKSKDSEKLRHIKDKAGVRAATRAVVRGVPKLAALMRV